MTGYNVAGAVEGSQSPYWSLWNVRAYIRNVGLKG